MSWGPSKVTVAQKWRKGWLEALGEIIHGRLLQIPLPLPVFLEWHHHWCVPGESLQLAYRRGGRDVHHVRQDRPLPGDNCEDQPDPGHDVSDPPWSGAKAPTAPSSSGPSLGNDRPHPSCHEWALFFRPGLAVELGPLGTRCSSCVRVPSRLPGCGWGLA